MIVARLNLQCRHGHRHFVPERDLAEWVGKDCLRGTRTKEGLLAVRGRCLEPLAKIEDEDKLAGSRLAAVVRTENPT